MKQNNRNTRIVQILPTLAFGDAIGNDTLAIADILKSENFRQEVYAEFIDHRLPDNIAKPINTMSPLGRNDVLIYHASTGSKLNYDIPGFDCRKVMIYHNITPSEFFHEYSLSYASSAKTGYDGIRNLANRIDYVIADSDYNRRELIQMGYISPIDVCPIIIPFEDYEQKPDPKILKKYKGDGYTNLLFVGRLAPNKKPEDIIRAFYYYQKYFNSKSRLFLVGSSIGLENYSKRLHDYVDAMDLTGKVIFTGQIKFNAILAYYQLANVFVCMSEHEGFCVPLLEAMYFGIPIVAYKSTAVPETLGNGGILLEDKNPKLAAAAINRLVRDDKLREMIHTRQQMNLDRFRYDNVKTVFLGYLNQFLEKEKVL